MNNDNVDEKQKQSYKTAKIANVEQIDRLLFSVKMFWIVNGFSRGFQNHCIVVHVCLIKFALYLLCISY